MHLALLLVAMTAVEPVWFYPGAGDEIAVIEADSTVRGMPVRRTGWLMARVDDPGSLRSHGDVAELEVLPGDGHVVRLRPRDGVDEVAFSRTLRDRGDVAWSHPDLVLTLVPHALPDDPYVADQWHLENDGHTGWTAGVDINAELAWSVSTGAGALIAVIDSGVETAHPDLDVVPGWDYVGNDDDPNPDFESDQGKHGTAAAGVAAAIGDNGTGVAGVAYDGSVYAIRLLGFNTNIADIYSAFIEAIDAGAWVLSNSWGFGDDCPDIPEYEAFTESMAYADDVGRGGLGTAVVASAGNGNCDLSNDGFQAQPQVISVAAANGHDHREGYSSYGDHVDITAPTGLLTTDLSGPDAGYGSHNDDPDYYPYFSGTSGAAPVVSGALALMFAANDRLTAADARAVLCETAVRMDLPNGEYDTYGWSRYYGCGRVDAGAAVMAVVDAGGPTTPTVTAPLDDPWVERVLLQWSEATDPDDTYLTYEVTWWTAHDESTAVTEVVTEPHLDLTGLVSKGNTVSFHVAAADEWGPTAPSETVTFIVREWEPPTPDPGDDDDGDDGQGCQSGGEGAAASVLLGLMLISARRLRARLTR